MPKLKKVPMTWELRQLLPPDVYDAWDTLSEREQDMLSRSVLFAEEGTRDRVQDSSFDSMAGCCDREHVDD